MQDTTPLTQEDKKKLQQMLDVWALLADQYTEKEFPPAMFRVFITVCLEEGLGTEEIAVKARTPTTTVTRHVNDMGDKDRYGGPGLELVYQTFDKRDRRKHPVFLTPKGRGLLGRILRLLGKVHK
jgi:DNA-binding MarR family transcriptional regulator